MPPPAAPCLISRKHARFAVSGVCWTVTDLGSLNGVRVNEVPLVPHCATALLSGDVVRLGGGPQRDDERSRREAVEYQVESRSVACEPVETCAPVRGEKRRQSLGGVDAGEGPNKRRRASARAVDELEALRACAHALRRDCDKALVWKADAERATAQLESLRCAALRELRCASLAVR